MYDLNVIIFFFVAQKPKSGLAQLTVEVSRSLTVTHTHTHDRIHVDERSVCRM